MRRTQQSSIEALEKAIEEQKNTRDFNYINDLKMLRKQYTCTSKRDYLKLLDLLVDKYSVEETAAVHAALLKKVQAGDLDAIRLWNEMSKENRDGGTPAEMRADRRSILSGICSDYLTYPENLMYTGVWRP